MRSLPPSVLCALVLALNACGDKTTVGLPPDAGSPSFTDSGSPPVDAGVDAGEQNAGIDAGEQDAGIDAGEQDAGVDAGEQDGGVDAGPVDAGTPDAGPPPVTFVRFVAFGDAGKGNTEQFAVGTAMRTVCAARGGCNFGLILGDNFYASGVESVSDPQWQSAFEMPYAGLDFRFYAVLGNHDYGQSGTGTDYNRAQNEIDYTQHSNRWYMPARHYTFTEGPVDFFALDMNAVMLSDLPAIGDDLTKIKQVAQDERDAMPGRLAASHSPWRIAFGHHPYLSNGRHGNAGFYDFVPTLGNGVKAFVETHLKGKVDVYLAGHDHNMQDLGNVGGTEFLVAGAGASTTSLQGFNPSEFQSELSGFLLVEASQTQLVFTFFDSSANQLHTRTVTR